MTPGQLAWSWYGAIWPNLIASGICACITLARVRVHLRRHEERLRSAPGPGCCQHDVDGDRQDQDGKAQAHQVLPSVQA